MSFAEKIGFRIRNMEGLTYDQIYYRTVRKFRERPTRRSNKETVCAYCKIPLISKFGGKFRRKFCDGCAESPRLKKEREQAYQRKKYLKWKRNKKESKKEKDNSTVNDPHARNPVV